MKIFCFWLGGWFTWWAVGTAAVGAVGSYLSKPKAPAGVQVSPTDLRSTTATAIEANQANEGGIEALISRGNTFAQTQATSLQEQAMPGYTKLASSLTGQAQKLADNPYAVPADVTKNLERIAAERGISAGTRGQFNDFSLLRDLGVNELQYGQANLSAAEGITRTLASIAPKVNPMSPLSFYATPAQAIGVTETNASNRQAVDQATANANAAANNAANADLWGSLTKLGGQWIQSKTGNTDNTDGTTANPELAGRLAASYSGGP